MNKNAFIAAGMAAFLVVPQASAQDDPFAPDNKPGPPTREELRRNLPKLIQVQIEWIQLDHSTLTDLLFLRDLKGDSTELRKEVQDLVRKEKAEILETAIVITRSGQKAVAESIKEKIYPTEYEPAEVPNDVEVTGNTTAETLAQLVTPPTPTAFETRNLGTTLEVEPVVGADDKTIDLRFAPEIVKDFGVTTYGTLKDTLGNENHITMPLFYSMRVSTGLTVRDGQYRFAGVHSPPNAEGEVERSKKIMVFAKCDLLTIGEESLPPVETKSEEKKAK